MTQGLALGGGGAGEGVRREHARSLGADVVVGVFRLVKLTQMHDLDNQATQRQLEELEKLVRDYCLQAGCDVNILFARRAVFLAGQLLRASHGEYDSAAELGATLERLGGSELTIARDVTAQDLRGFAEAIAASLRERAGAFRSPTPRIRLRPVNDAARVRGLEVETLPVEQRIVRTYASAVVLLRRFHEQLAAADYTPPRRLKRVAQSLVDLSTAGTLAFLRVTEARNANSDEAGRCVNTAILSVAVAREVTSDRAQLAQIALAAMVLDAGRPRAAAGASQGPGMSSVAAQLTEEALEALPAGTAAVLTALGRLNDATIRRTVVAYEALRMRHGRALGPVYGGLRPPTLHARIVAICRRYNDLLTPEPGLPPATPEMAIATLHGELGDVADRTVLRMLVATLGLYPVGTVVRLSSGEVGEVFAVEGHTAPRDRPCVRVALDPRGGVLDRPVEIDLAAAGVDPQLRIVAVVSVDGWSKGLAAPRPRAVSWSEPPSGQSSVSKVRAVSAASRRPEAETAESPAGIVPPSNPPSADRPAVRRVSSTPAPAADVADRTVVQRSPFEDVQDRTPLGPASDRNVLIVERAPVSEPTARGQLSATPLVQVLVYMLDHKLSGTLVLREPDGVESTVIFVAGGPVKVSSGRPVARLGELLVEMGVATRPDVAPAVVEAKRSGVLLGARLVERGALDADTLRAALTRQVVEKLVGLVRAPPETTYAFFQDTDHLEDWPSAETFPAHPLDAIIACTRAWSDRARIHATLARMANASLELSVAAELDRVAFTDAERALLARMRDAHPTLTELQREHGADDETLASLVYVLAVTRQLAFLAKRGLPMGREHGEARPVSDADDGRISRVSWLPRDPTGSSPDSSRKPPSVTPAPSSVKPVPPPVTPAPSSVKPAPPSVASAPPPLPSKRPPVVSVPPPLPSKRPPVVTSATAPPPPVVVTTPPPPSVSERPPEGRPSRRAPRIPTEEARAQAVKDVGMADEALAQGAMAMALKMATRAALADPGNRDASALVAWLHGSDGKPQHVAEAIAELTSSLDEDPRHVRTLLFRARLRKRSGKTPEAIADLEAALAVDPDNREVEGELRAMRGKPT